MSDWLCVRVIVDRIFLLRTQHSIHSLLKYFWLLWELRYCPILPLPPSSRCPQLSDPVINKVDLCKQLQITLCQRKTTSRLHSKAMFPNCIFRSFVSAKIYELDSVFFFFGRNKLDSIISLKFYTTYEEQLSWFSWEEITIKSYI